MKFLFVTVNYNNSFITMNYIASIHAMFHIDENQVDIVVVDNASEEKQYEYLRKMTESCKDVKLIRNEINSGYFPGLNTGIKSTNGSAYDYVIAGNNDVFFDRSFLRTLKEKSYKKKQTVIVPDVVTLNGIHQNPQFIECPSKQRQFGYKVYYSFYLLALLIDLFYMLQRKKRMRERMNKLNTPTEIFQCTAVMLILRPEFFEHCGYLDESLFLWGEEVALARQIREAGDRMLYDPDIVVTHIENATVGKFGSYKKYKIWQRSYKVYKDYYTM